MTAPPPPEQPPPPPPGDRPAYHPEEGVGAPPPRNNGPAIAAMVCGLVALVLCWIPVLNLLSVVLGIAAVITGIIGLRAAPERGGRGMAITGLVTGSLGALAAVIVLVLFGTAVSELVEDPEFQEQMDEIEQEFEQQELETEP